MIIIKGVWESVLSVEKLVIIKLTVMKIKTITNLIMEVPRILICVVSESLLTDVDSRARWVDSASSRHVAKMRDFFVDMKRLKPVIIVCTWEITNIVMC